MVAWCYKSDRQEQVVRQQCSVGKSREVGVGENSYSQGNISKRTVEALWHSA